jgi:hypothetical protein
MSDAANPQEMTGTEVRDELENLTGHRFVSEMPALRTWMSAEQVAALPGPTFDGEQVKAAMQMVLLAARAAYSKGWQAGQRAEVAGAEVAKAMDQV